MFNRGKHLVSLALNKSFQEKVSAVRKCSSNRKEVEEDPDFVLESEERQDTDSDPEVDEFEHTDITTDIIIERENCASIEFVERVILPILLENVMAHIEHKQKLTYTKKGQIRKRRCFDTTPSERKKRKLASKIEKFQVKEPCKDTCKFKCASLLNKDRQTAINTQFWQLKEEARKTFIFNSTKKENKKRQTAGPNSARQFSYKYFLKTANALDVQVCKRFFLATLGYTFNNDRVLKNVRKTNSKLITPKADGRGCQPCPHKIDRQVIVEHVNLFNPVQSHYRREHAPNTRYLPSDITIRFMYNDFKEKNKTLKVSYELYRKVVSDDLKISFAKLGHEECWQCEIYNLHKKENHEEGTLCEECQKWNVHHMKYVTAREEYKNDADKKNGLFFSADLEKVIMIPRVDMFKEVVFTKRIIVFNESFVPIGKKQKRKPLAILWHEALAGRSKEDLISTYYAFFQLYRDETEITLWLDNCSAQNKNWTIFSFFVYLVNSPEVSLNKLNIKYLETGHTFMSADYFHHQVELSLKKKGKIYDFGDFADAVKSANLSNVDIVEMKIEQFYDWPDYCSKYKLQKLQPRVYLHDMVWVSFERGSQLLEYKIDFKGDFVKLNFLTATAIKTNLPKPQPRTQYRGISKERKEGLLAKLSQIMPKNRVPFWQNLPVAINVPEEL